LRFCLSEKSPSADAGAAEGCDLLILKDRSLVALDSSYRECGVSGEDLADVAVLDRYLLV
jgi:hypothetical protein